VEGKSGKIYIVEKEDWMKVGGKTGIGQRMGPPQNDGLDPPMESQAAGLFKERTMS